jgi:hypothetical protein
MAHRELPPKGTSPFNVPISTGENARKKIDNPKNIGFRGRHAHGRAPDDPVYPTRQLGASPRMGFVDWRTGGRALLVAALGLIEGKVLRRRGELMKWQMFPPCGSKCGWSCQKSKSRVLCDWFTPGTVHEHIARMDGVLTRFKGAQSIDPAKPPIRPLPQVAMRNRFCSVPATVTRDGRLVPVEPTVHPAFGRSPAHRRDPTSYPEDDGTLSFTNGYDSDDDPEQRARIDVTLVDERSRQEADFFRKYF